MREKPASVRLATVADEEAIFDLLVALWRHNGKGWGFPYRPEIVLTKIQAGTRPDVGSRMDPRDQTRGLIGVIEDAQVPGRFIGSVGIFLEPPLWFSDAVVPAELWLFVCPEARRWARHQKALFEFALWAHEQLGADLEKKGYPLPWVMPTGFMQVEDDPKRYAKMERLWRMMSGGRKVGTLFWVE